MKDIFLHAGNQKYLILNLSLWGTILVFGIFFLSIVKSLLLILILVIYSNFHMAIFLNNLIKSRFSYFTGAWIGGLIYFYLLLGVLGIYKRNMTIAESFESMNSYFPYLLVHIGYLFNIFDHFQNPIYSEGDAIQYSIFSIIVLLGMFFVIIKNNLFTRIFSSLMITFTIFFPIMKA